MGAARYPFPHGPLTWRRSLLRCGWVVAQGVRGGVREGSAPGRAPRYGVGYSLYLRIIVRVEQLMIHRAVAYAYLGLVP